MRVKKAGDGVVRRLGRVVQVEAVAGTRGDARVEACRAWEEHLRGGEEVGEGSLDGRCVVAVSAAKGQVAL